MINILILIATMLIWYFLPNQDGYKNLVKLVSMGFIEGFYYRPRIDYEVLEQYSQGLIGLSGCLAGDIPRMLLSEQKKAARDLALRLERIFGEGNFYLELQNHGLEEQLSNQMIVELSNDTGIPLVASNVFIILNMRMPKS